MTNNGKRPGTGHKVRRNKAASGTEGGYAASAPRSVFGCLRMMLELLACLVELCKELVKLLRQRAGAHAPQTDPGQKRMTCYHDVVRLVRAVREDESLDNIRSIPKAVNFVRSEAKPDSGYYNECLEARMCVRKLAKKRADGIDMAWRTIAKMSQPSYRGAQTATPRRGRSPYPTAAGPTGYSPLASRKNRE